LLAHRSLANPFLPPRRFLLLLSRSKLIKEVCGACLEKILDRWPVPLISRFSEVVCSGLHSGLEDASPDVRTCCRAGFYRMRELDPAAAER